MDNKGQTKQLTGILVTAFVVLGLIVAGNFFFPGLLSVTGDGGAREAVTQEQLDTGEGQVFTCESGTNSGILFTLKEERLDNGDIKPIGPTTTLDGNVFVDGVSIGVDHDTTTEFDTLPKTSDKEFTIYLNDASDGTQSHFGKVVTGQGFCEEQRRAVVGVAAQGAFDIRVNNTDDDTNNTSTNALALGAGEQGEFEVRVKEATALEWLAPPNGPLNVAFVCDFHNVMFDDCRISNIDNTLIGTPRSHPRNFSGDINVNDSVAYELTGLTTSGRPLFDFESKTFTVILETASGLNPTPDNNASFVFYHPQLYYNTKTGIFEWAYRQNDDGSQLFAPNGVTVYLS